jgi:hypothetical protein
MVIARITITIPEDVLGAVDDAARDLGESRSRYVSRILRAAVKALRDAGITCRLDELFADPNVVDEQQRVTGEMDSVGTDWSDETW